MRLFSAFFLLLVSSISHASTITYWYPSWSGAPAVKAGSAYQACVQGAPYSGSGYAQWVVYNNGTQVPFDGSSNIAGCWRKTSSETQYYYRGTVYRSQPVNCPYGDDGNYQCNASCDAPKVMENGQCVTPTNPCTEKTGTGTQWKKTWASFDAYTSMGEQANQGGCAVTISSMECGSNAAGEFACWGSGTYTGAQDTTSGEVDDCVNPESCTPPEPTTSDSSQECSAPTTTGSTTTYTCVTSSSAEQFAGSNCAYGEVNGTTGYHCTAPAYVPASDSQTRTDEVSETTNPDGSKTTTTTSTTQKTYCEAGACNTTTTTTTTTKGTDAAGNPTGETTTCTGDECKGPEDPKDGKMPGTVPGPSTAEAFPEIGGGNEVATYAESTEAFYNRIGNAPIVAALGSIEVPTGGSCSIGSAALFGGSVSFDEFCDLAPQVLAGLRYLFLAIWAWAAIRLFFTA